MDLNVARYFDESESSSDEDVVIQYVLMRRPKTFRSRNPPLEIWDDEDFCQRYRLSKETVLWIDREIGSRLKSPTTRYVT